jgi:kynurenine formamidase
MIILFRFKDQNITVVKEQVKLINESFDVSGSPDGVCIVTRSILLSNSHAGTHADQPKHFDRNPPFSEFNDLQYNGPCIVLNLMDSLHFDKSITVEQLKPMIEKLNIKKDLVSRILLRTRNAPNEEQEWQNEFAHLDPKCADWLVQTFPNLVLVGIDTPSIDHPTASPIIHCSHGALWKQRVAILENLNLGVLFTQSDNRTSMNVIHGYIQTIWNPMQIFEDSKGCLAQFYWRHENKEP